jgi:hypothetical protein
MLRQSAKAATPSRLTVMASTSVLPPSAPLATVSVVALVATRSKNLKKKPLPFGGGFSVFG